MKLAIAMLLAATTGGVSAAAEFSEQDIFRLVEMSRGIPDTMSGRTFEGRARYRESHPLHIGSHLRLVFDLPDSGVAYCDAEDLRDLKGSIPEDQYAKALAWDWTARTLKTGASGVIRGKIRLVSEAPSVTLADGCTFTPDTRKEPVEQWK